MPLEGDHVLTISASGTAMPEPGSFEVPARLGRAGAVAEVQVNGWFEGYTQVYAGLDLARLREGGAAHVWVEKILDPGEPLRDWQLSQLRVEGQALVTPGRSLDERFAAADWQQSSLIR